MRPAPVRGRDLVQFNERSILQLESDMGRYVLAWLFGVPATVLVLVYLILHQ
jgi:hypothetical protein